MTKHICILLHVKKKTCALFFIMDLDPDTHTDNIMSCVPNFARFFFLYQVKTPTVFNLSLICTKNKLFYWPNCKANSIYIHCDVLLTNRETNRPEHLLGRGIEIFH